MIINLKGIDFMQSVGKSIGKTIIRLREERNLSAKDLASLTNKSQSYISKLETGNVRSPRKETMKEILIGMKMNQDEIEEVLSEFYKTINIELWDMCLFITQDGKFIFSEISQDNARYKYVPKNGNLESLDKDVFRSGNSSEDVMEKWEKLYKLVDNHIKNN